MWWQLFYCPTIHVYCNCCMGDELCQAGLVRRALLAYTVLLHCCPTINVYYSCIGASYAQKDWMRLGSRGASCDLGSLGSTLA